jgi:hypothetical protein
VLHETLSGAVVELRPPQYLVTVFDVCKYIDVDSLLQQSTATEAPAKQ